MGVPVVDLPKMSILGLSYTSPFTAIRFVLFGTTRRGGSSWTDLTLIEMVAAYYRIGAEEEVRPEVGLGQSAKETGYWTFEGDVRASQWNFAGIGATGGGRPGISWPSLEEGVRGHLRRLRMYASASAPYDLDILRRSLPLSYWGASPDVEDLGGRWAKSPTYGISVRQYVNTLISS